MKKALFTFALTLMALGASAKDIKTVVVTTNPQMHCASCENKIKGNLRFEKGVKQIDCDIKNQRVTITYDADKVNSETIINAFGKFGYKAVEVKKEGEKQEKDSQKTDK